MYKKLSILKIFFEDPIGEYHIREIARLTRLNHMTVSNYLIKFVKINLLNKKKTKLYPTYSANFSNKEFINLKLYYNLEQLRKSEIIGDLEKKYDYPAIVLFGSYASATNTKDSDVDICVITNINKEFSLTEYEKRLNKKISIFKFGEKELKNMKIKNPELVNNICNGIMLSGKLEVI